MLSLSRDPLHSSIRRKKRVSKTKQNLVANILLRYSADSRIVR